MTSILDTVGQFIDLRELPFTERGSRILCFDRGDGIDVVGAVYERNATDCTYLSGLTLLDHDGGAVPVAGARPDQLRWLADAATLTFIDPCRLSLGVTAGVAAITFTPTGTVRAQDGWSAAQAPGASLRWSCPGAQQQINADGTVTLSTLGGAELTVEIISTPDGADSDQAESDAALHGTLSGTDGQLVAAGGHDGYLAKSAERWNSWFSRCPVVDEAFAPMAHFAWWTLASNIVRLAVNPGIEAVVPSKQGYVAAWQWDSYFISFGLRHGAPELAADQIRLFFAEQAPDGSLPDVVHDHGTLATVADLPPGDIAMLTRLHGADSPMVQEAALPITKPPLAAWACAAVDEASGGDVFGELSGPLARLRRWWLERPSPDGLPGFEHVYSSGLDDSPLFDDGAPVFAPDLPSYLVHEADIWAAHEGALGNAGAQLEHAERAAEMSARLCAERFDPATERFVAITPAGRRQTRTPFGLFPLLTGRLPEHVKQAMLDQLDDGTLFAAPNPLPTVAMTEPEFGADTMWRGPVWINVNWMICQGLRRSGEEERARVLAQQTVRMVIDGRGFFEYWNPLTGARAEGATAGFAWSAALFLDLAVWLSGQE